MGRSHFIIRALATLTASIVWTACTVHKQETPPLTGPSELGTAIVVTVSPDVLVQDGASQSLIQITARDSNGQPMRNASLRVEVAVDGAIADFGSLSARNVVTDANGRASVVYTAPPAPVFAIVTDTIIEVLVTPAGTDFGNALPRSVKIRLTPPGNVGQPESPFRPDFVAPGAVVGTQVVFDAIVVDASGADATAQVGSYQWSFGDGSTASGRSVTHTYRDVGTFAVSLTITDVLGRTRRVTHSMAVTQGQLPVAQIVVSPASPIVNQTINFNGSGSTAEPGHRVTGWDWTFGDGSAAGGPLVTHSYHDTGTYTVTLQVTDDVGRKSTLVQQSITVGTGNPTADFNFNPSAPRSGQQVVFDASPSQAAPGRTIVSYSWSFGDGGSGSGQSVTHAFTTGLTPTTYNVLLTVTDNIGRTSSVTKPITINP
jgi:PKD repeat protein